MLLQFLLVLPALADLVLLLQIWRENSIFKFDGKFCAPASIIVPVRGLDPELERNVESLKNQDFPCPFEIIYVVDPDQPWLAERLRQLGVKVVITSFTCSCSGKIRAQLSGLKESVNEVVVFADSDTLYPRNWLREMVGNLDRHMAVTTFSWPVPLKITWRNLIRAGFWTLGFESQASGGTFLWGGSMAFRRDFFDSEVLEELSREWCDDCTLTRIVKRRGGSIAFDGKAIPLNIYDERDLWRWSTRQVVTIIKYSSRGAKAFLVIGALMLAFPILFLVFLNPFYLSPLLLWILKNFSRSRNLGKYSYTPSVMSILGVYYGWIKLILDYRKRTVVWRDRVYNL
ncbi:glycosyltransferase [Metallosphaera sedula]|uniref:glycosyltransferase n=1 Tax=Metallosphaera sedula TaxID=43687 RepID=UPI0020BDE4B8|nr:glycosyltransferase family 2 protein [Metallosphaera sedula]BBL46806.1 glycosyl transferase family 2 [Metallosphaera sedula]